ncbi:DUF1168-domain-containing protein [Trametes versicolor FP-101664 SS1]|uniref:DUF1168-domain-containing protein n=1 Tax=Trametes versicolor (strain FP-101664) TaxID=717944 RepID=UPI000462258D|nr:DUF1168-domain-containing protein [Trametes versicolor FP-101664 SS1]EIW62894.1 DUF1168-domain-containing protein [Trametes versicolor FP-101664 SS1]
MSTSPAPSPSLAPGGSRHAATPLDKQRVQLEKLLKDPAKPAYIPPPPKDKSIRPAREMMKNVQGSSAGAGSGEFHVYKASRRREYERLKVMDEEAQKEAEEAEFERRKREREEQAEAKTSKNRAKRQKKKERAKGKGTEKDGQEDGPTAGPEAARERPDVPLKKRRLVNGKELVFRRPGEGSDDEDEDVGPNPQDAYDAIPDAPPVAIADTRKITIIEED